MSDPYLTGDPAGMRAFSARLLQLADQIEHGASRAGHASSSAGYQGPAADRFRAQIAQLSQNGTSAANQLSDLAGRISKAATHVEDAQAAERRRLEKEAEQRQAEQRAAAGMRR